MKPAAAASLQNLNDIVLPPAVDWWPLAPGWYVLAGLLVLVLAWFGYRSVRRWQANRYRRAALIELQQLSRGMEDASMREACLRQVPVLLKRAAVSAYPRSQVAALTGAPWVQFLNSTLSRPVFTPVVGCYLDQLAYETGNLHAIDAQARAELLASSRKWLQSHRPPSTPPGTGAR